jgi:ribosomal protein S18 acetylase RimI-like enzyme
MNAAAARAKERNLDRMVLDVRVHNKGALAFYEALGYAPIQLRMARPTS